MRSRLRRAAERAAERVFSVELQVHQLDSIPPIQRLLYIHWRGRRAIPSFGSTPSLPVEAGNLVRWNFVTTFKVTIPADPADASVLQPSPLLLQLRSERRSRYFGNTTFTNEGTVEIDLSDVAAVGFSSRNHLVQNHFFNTTLRVSLRVSHISGDKIFRTGAVAAASPSSPAPGHERPAVPQSFGDGDSASTLPSPTNASHSIPGRRIQRSASASANLPSGLLSAFAPGASTNGGFGSEGDPAASAVFGAGGRPNRANPASVLESSIPNPELLQHHVYERMFQAQQRDEWPAHIVKSRVDPTEEVNRLYAKACRQRGMGGAGVDQSLDIPELPKADKTLSLELLIESRNGIPAPSGGTSLARKRSAASSRMGVRSCSVGDIGKLARQTTA